MGTKDKSYTEDHKVKCSLIGARGYAGLELARLLLCHPNVKLESCFATGDFKLENFLANPAASKVQCYPQSEIFNYLSDLYFLATPAEVSLDLIPKLIGLGKKVIDLSGAFRLKSYDYQAWYGFEHSEKKLLNQAFYGLIPWTDKYNLKETSLIANPGCYATSVNLALIPLLKHSLIEIEGIVVDAKSGTTGAGKKASENLLFSEVEAECLPYKIGTHQHYPEILEAIEKFSDKKITPHFSTSLLPIRRGIISSIYANLKVGVNLEDIHECFQRSYQNYPLVEYGPLAVNSRNLSLKKVVGTGKTHITYEVVGDKLYLFSCLDNLMKGAASQAIENFNQLYNLNINTGLCHLEAIV